MLLTPAVICLYFILLMPGIVTTRRASLSADNDHTRSEILAAVRDTLPVPTDPHELRTWLGSGTYTTWPHQAAPKPADSPHGDQAQVFLNPSLSQSVGARMPVHHQGAAAVLELSDENGLAWGWAVAVKAQASSNHGQGWYWYQVNAGPESGRTDFGGYVIPSETDDAGLGLRTCLTCHVKGHDYIITRSLD